MEADKRAAIGRKLYPMLEPRQTDIVNSRLAELVSLLHTTELSEAQKTEIIVNIGLQTSFAETLHRYPLNNQDEPAFLVDPIRLTSDA